MMVQAEVPTHRVIITETPGGDQPLAKAEGHVTGFQTQLDEAVAYAQEARDRVERLRAEYARVIADAEDNVGRADAAVADLNGAVHDAEAAIPAARQAQAEYDALPQSEKDRLAAEKALARARVDAANAAEALKAAEDAAAAAAAAAENEG